MDKDVAEFIEKYEFTQAHINAWAHIMHIEQVCRSEMIQILDIIYPEIQDYIGRTVKMEIARMILKKSRDCWCMKKRNRELPIQS